MTDLRTAAPALAGPRSGALAWVLGVGAAVALGLAILPLDGVCPRAVGASLYALIGLVLVDRIAVHHPHDRFGLGNVVTLSRAGGTALLAAVACAPDALDPRALVTAAGLLLALDGADGWLARRHGLASPFGARFDMEIDALLILVLSLLAVGLGKAGVWIVAIGLMRWAFVAAGVLLPALARPLPPSRRRSTICGLQVTVLAVLLVPAVVPPASSLLAALALALLTASFAADVAWLLRR